MNKGVLRDSASTIVVTALLTVGPKRCAETLRAQFKARSASTLAAGPYMPPTAPIIARRRSASLFRACEDVVQTIAAAHRFGAPILSRGCGTSLAGQCCNVAVVMDFSKYMHDVVRIDGGRESRHRATGLRARRFATCRRRARTHFRARPRPRTVIARWVACSATILVGALLACAKHGRGLRTADNTHSLEVLTYDGLRLHVGRRRLTNLRRSSTPGARVATLCANSKPFATNMRTRSARDFPNCPPSLRI